MTDLGRALGYLRPYWLIALGAFLSLILVTVTNLISPQVLRAVVDQGITRGNLGVIVLQSLLFLGIAVVRDVFTFTQGYWSEKASQSAAYDMRNAIFSRLENLSFSYHDQAQIGQLMTRVTSDVDNARQFTGVTLLEIVNALVMLVGSATILLVMNWRLALLSLLLIPIVLVIFITFLRVIAPRFRFVQQKLGALNTILQENLSGVRVVKAFAREPYELTRYRAANADLLDENLKVIGGVSIAFPLVFFFANLGTLLIIAVGGSQVISGTFSIGELVAFNSYLSFLLFPIFTLAGSFSSLAQSSASTRRVFEVLDAPIEVISKPGAVEMTHIHGRIAFEEVSFRYAGSERDSLDTVSFVVEEGQTVAVLGRTGSGKSTLINLIPRFYDVTAGRVMVDEYDVRDVTVASLRRHVGIVLQDTMLFSGTIRENIAFGKPSATDEEIETAAKLAQAHDFIAAFADGYATVIGERGIGLSGGQRQRISIARTLLLNPPFLILDDSTSALDAETEYQIQQALKRLMLGRTSFIIAQRISTVRDANLILLLDNGKLVAQGTHEHLLRDSSLYAEIVESQLRGDQIAIVAA